MVKKPTYEKLEQMVKKLEKEVVKRKRTEGALQESEHKYRTLLECLPQKIFHKDRNSVYVSCNENYARDLKIKPEEISGKTDYELFPKGLAEKYREDDKRIVTLKKTEEIEEKYIQKGQEVWVQTVKTPVKDEKGDITGVFGIFWDITERRRAAESLQKSRAELEQRVEERTIELTKINEQLKDEIQERKRAEGKLREKEERYRTLISEMLNGFALHEIMVDNNDKPYDYRFLEVNTAFEDMTGLQGVNIIGRTILEVLPKTESYWIENYGEVALTGKSVRFENYAQELEKYFEVLAYSPQKGQFATVFTDITDRKQAEEERKKLEAQLHHAQKMEAIGTLAGGIAHDFNNLLMGIQGNASLMLLNIDSRHPYYERLQNIEKQVESGTKLTSHLLGYARKGKYEVKPVDLNELIEETCGTFGRTRKDMNIHIEIADDLFAIEADSGQIEQVLLNLFINAADAVPGGGDLFLKTMNVTHKDLTGKVYKPNRGRYVMLTVTDTGMGMDKETMERVFEPFFTTKEMGIGTGLGLASTYGIIKGHGGHIDVESKKGQGTTFSIYLPASEKKVQRVAKTDEQVIEGTGMILLVDDEDVILEVGQDLLEAMGYQVFIAKDGKEAIEVYEKNRDDLDIVVLDMVMPNMGGGETYDRMRKINPNIKVLLSSGYSIDGEATEILERGCDAFIQKPFKIKELSEAIGKILGKK